jgi:hypothetical protein
MKTIKILSFILLSVLSINLGFAQGKTEVNLPETVTTAIANKYPQAQIGHWNYNSNNKWYEVNFKFEDHKYTGYYTQEGSWVRTERNIRKLALPQTVITALQASEHAGWEIRKAEEHQTPKHDYLYEVEVRSGQQEVYLYFLPDGKQIDSRIKK